MVFEEVFLDKNALQKYQMFQSLVVTERQQLTINDLATDLNLNYQQAYATYKELVNDMEQITATTIKTGKWIEPAQFPITVDEYRLFLLRNAIAFQFIDYIVQADQPSLAKFCSEHFTSQSTLTRKMVPVKKLLQHYRLNFSYTTLEFEGDEKGIRLFLNLFYWISFHGIEWPFKHVRLDSIQETFAHSALPDLHPDPIVQIQDLNLIAICRLRILQNHIISDMSRYTDIVGPDHRIDLYHSRIYDALPHQQRVAESQFFSFVVNRSLRYHENWGSLQQEFLQQDQFHEAWIWQFVQQLIDNLSSYCKPRQANSLRHDRQLFGNLLRVVISFTVMEGDYAKMIDFYYPSRLAYEQSNLFALVKKVLAQLQTQAEFASTRHFGDTFLHEVYYLILPYLKSFRINQVVYVKTILESADLVTRELYTFLEDMNTVELLGSDDPLESADLVITSLSTTDPYLKKLDLEGIKVVNWNIDALDSDYMNLYMVIKEIYLDKIL
ncbi:transcriptional regulator [Lactobacillus selangorensis]|uniref:Transcriptional regulator n=1 Tax=Lactobacillus selangorensis TaxID=81857 RepID=A0A0R2FRA3_9LACO|nr:helix-turn-helix domain-containing protein [Lactobacillus selangorensis]KRN28244.1 transcriptional regulator [Lactobacillus selangorensis]KRN30880.1 transcriptional regulator [Lactobacillus selangorensis]